MPKALQRNRIEIGRSCKHFIKWDVMLSWVCWHGETKLKDQRKLLLLWVTMETRERWSNSKQIPYCAMTLVKIFLFLALTRVMLFSKLLTKNVPHLQTNYWKQYWKKKLKRKTGNVTELLPRFTGHFPIAMKTILSREARKSYVHRLSISEEKKRNNLSVWQTAKSTFLSLLE